MQAPAIKQPAARDVRLSDQWEVPPWQVVTLSNGRYTVHLSSVGSGYSECGGLAVSRSPGDETRDADGFYVYLRDLEDGFVWSAGYQPTRVAPVSYDFRAEKNAVEIRRLDRDIECRLIVCVSPDANFEVRCCELSNRGSRTRNIELTSYLEWVLTRREADACHPAFSKLFVETQFWPAPTAGCPAIVARRRPRHGDDPEFWGGHWLVADCPGEIRGSVEFETNRTRFVGRGRSLALPHALETRDALTGDCGAVLDPIASLRTSVIIEPGETRQLAFLVGTGASRHEMMKLLATANEFTHVDRVLRAPQSANPSRNGDAGSDEAAISPGRRSIIHAPHHPSTSSFDESASRHAAAPRYRAADDARSDGAPQAARSQPLVFDNGYGGFTADGHEYVIRLEPDSRGRLRRPPLPWCNVIANEQAGFLVTEAGAGYTWAGNSRENRITAWHNDPLLDPHSEAIWIRDDDADVFWSPMPGPTPANAHYIVRHGFGYTVFEHTSQELSQEVALFVPRDEPVKLVRVRIANRSGRQRRLSLFSMFHWALANPPGEPMRTITTQFDDEQQAIWANNLRRERYGDYTAFSAVASDQDSASQALSYTCDRAAFLGRYGEMNAPAAVAGGGEELDGRCGENLDPCAAWQVSIELPPNGSCEYTFLLGEAADRQRIANVINKYRDSVGVQSALDEVISFWRDTLSAITIETPARELDLMVNGWLAYQNLSCRMWARSAYYQPGGAFGFRDQLQDSSALVYHHPDLTRAQILRNASHQFTEGDVLHWWHPDTGYGLRTRFSDDLLWLPLIAAEYVERTGDKAVLDEILPFIAAPSLAEGQQESFLLPRQCDETATLYEHCCRALDRGLTTGSHGLPLIGCGDWNDGFSCIGRLGRGESVWLGFFIDCVLERMLPICTARDDQERVRRYSAYRQQLRQALNTAGWDGAWYRRAYYDDGQPIGSAASDECRIDALAQAWSVISGVAPPDRAKMAMDAVDAQLVDDEAGIIRLLTPPFDRTPNDPGYIKGYLPGIRENGGQYTHGVLWVVRAMAELRRGTRAVELLRMLTPVWHARSAEQVGVYQTEPYVVAADIYGAPPHVGRGGWTWYTGSAGWMLRVALESIFGFSVEGGRTLVMNPAISAQWPQCRLNYRLPDGKTCYEITIDNPHGREHGVGEAFVDGVSVCVENGAARIPLAHDGAAHRVMVRL